ncbi:hypothetical protein GH714_012051 [Hevea brasiliensis]|uniref:Disease resistance protein At4g27190-like leucine-rich repeats domain-containing protein n=1 Tax=Hevea brasiliensis TaxID=3981 RepID=A0A6A6L0X2_HEVBR|nr:hypothetical protein GH714_012051 [Hevea brasiliensis]
MPQVEDFTAGASSTPKLHGLRRGCGSNGEVQLSNFPMLKEKWHGQFPFENLKCLRKLVVDDCAVFSNAVAIPSLEELRVEYNTMKDMWSQADFLSGLKALS